MTRKTTTISEIMTVTGRSKQTLKYWVDLYTDAKGEERIKLKPTMHVSFQLEDYLLDKSANGRRLKPKRGATVRKDKCVPHSVKWLSKRMPSGHRPIPTLKQWLKDEYGRGYSIHEVLDLKAIAFLKTKDGFAKKWGVVNDPGNVCEDYDIGVDPAVDSEPNKKEYIPPDMYSCVWYAKRLYIKAKTIAEYLEEAGVHIRDLRKTLPMSAQVRVCMMSTRTMKWSKTMIEHANDGTHDMKPWVGATHDGVNRACSDTITEWGRQNELSDEHGKILSRKEPVVQGNTVAEKAHPCKLKGRAITEAEKRRADALNNGTGVEVTVMVPVQIAKIVEAMGLSLAEYTQNMIDVRHKAIMKGLGQ